MREEKAIASIRHIRRAIHREIGPRLTSSCHNHLQKRAGRTNQGGDHGSGADQDSGSKGSVQAALQAVLVGTPVLTLDGELPVEFLQPGDRVLTRSGMRRLKQVEVSVIQNARVVTIAHGTLGVDRPAQDVTVSAGQEILVRDWRAKAMFGTSVAMIAAKKLADGEYIRCLTLPEARLFTLRFEDEVVIYAGGLELTCRAVVTA